MANQYSTVMSKANAEALRARLKSNASFRERERLYALYCYEGMDVAIAYFPKRSKLVVQGNGTDDFVRLVLPEFQEPELGLTGGYLTPSAGTSATNLAAAAVTAHFGVDESGKGDYFGPLVVAGVYADENLTPQLANIGCKDSKQMRGDEEIACVARQIKELPGIAYEVLCIGPARYNEMYAQMKNLNTLLAWGHARVIAALHGKVPSCPRALSDQFANEWVLRRALRERHIPIKLEQHPRAETDLAVAAASILARARFVEWLHLTAQAAQCQLPLGCAPHVLTAARNFIAKHGVERLRDVAKLHFKLTKEIE